MLGTGHLLGGAEGIESNTHDPSIPEKDTKDNPVPKVKI
jgi:hypothetical protein